MLMNIGIVIIQKSIANGIAFKNFKKK